MRIGTYQPHILAASPFNFDPQLTFQPIGFPYGGTHSIGDLASSSGSDSGSSLLIQVAAVANRQ